MHHRPKADDFQHKPISEIINKGIPLFNTTHLGWGMAYFLGITYSKDVLRPIMALRELQM